MPLTRPRSQVSPVPSLPRRKQQRKQISGPLLVKSISLLAYSFLLCRKNFFYLTLFLIVSLFQVIAFQTLMPHGARRSVKVLNGVIPTPPPSEGRRDPARETVRSA